GCRPQASYAFSERRIDHCRCSQARSGTSWLEPVYHSPKASWHPIAPTTDINNPHVRTWLKRSRRSAETGADATPKAPMVGKGETSTRSPSIRIDEASASGLPPPSFATSPVTLGKKTGKTTPDVLL